MWSSPDYFCRVSLLLMPCAVDASFAGVGNLEIAIASNTDSPSNFVDADSAESLYRVTFTPLKPETYKIVVKFNGDPVPGDSSVGPFKAIEYLKTSLATPPHGAVGLHP